VNFQLYRTDLDRVWEMYEQSQRYKDICAGSQDDSGSFWLINAENITAPMDLDTLKEQGLAIPFETRKFAPPFKLYNCDKNGHLQLVFTKKPTDNFLPLVLRILGLQSTGITVSSFLEQQDHYAINHGLRSQVALVGALLFVAHERFTGTTLHNLFQSLEGAGALSWVLNEALKNLRKLYKADIKLNEQEAAMVLHEISEMNSSTFQGYQIDKTKSIQKLMRALEKNKFAMYKALQFRAKHNNSQWPFLYALDTAELLAENPQIAAMYHDDLLLFSAMINDSPEYVYHHARQDDNTHQIRANLALVKTFLAKAATEPQPNNLQYGIQALLYAFEYFSYPQFLAAFIEIDALGSFDPQKVDAILNKHEFAIRAQLP